MHRSEKKNQKKKLEMIQYFGNMPSSGATEMTEQHENRRISKE